MSRNEWICQCVCSVSSANSSLRGALGVQQLPLDVRLIQPPSFENFVTGPNQELVELLKNVAVGHRPAKCLLIWGQAGSGKSHLLNAVRSSSLADSGLVYLDGCEALGTQEQHSWFASFIAQAQNPQAMVIASASQAPLHLALRDDLRSRLGSGLVIQLKSLNDEEKAQALRQHAASRQIGLPEELLRYLLRHYPRDIRSLMKILENLDRYAFEHKRALSLPLLRDMEAG